MKACRGLHTRVIIQFQALALASHVGNGEARGEGNQAESLGTMPTNGGS